MLLGQSMQIFCHEIFCKHQHNHRMKNRIIQKCDLSLYHCINKALIVVQNTRVGIIQVHTGYCQRSHCFLHSPKYRNQLSTVISKLCLSLQIHVVVSGSLQPSEDDFFEIY